ncbi:uncharacterized protein LOC113791561 [Dermatophagoides pteronyssinus]|uniref:uncharacterized protein LOC113791561 n=1 Tax=Dermatophagoides pteronyssinus TaxID=6956 RepID=UPI003F67E307
MKIQNNTKNFHNIIMSIMIITILIITICNNFINCMTFNTKTLCESIRDTQIYEMLNILAIGLDGKENLIIMTKDKFIYDAPIEQIFDENNLHLHLEQITPSTMMNVYTQLNVNERFNLLYEYDQIHSAFFLTIMTKTSLCFISMDPSAQPSLNYWLDDNLVYESIDYKIPISQWVDEDIDDFVISNRPGQIEYFVWRNHRATGKSSIGIARLRSQSKNEEEIWKFFKENIVFQHICIENEHNVYLHPIPDGDCTGKQFSAIDVTIGFFTKNNLILMGERYVYKIPEKVLYNMSKSEPYQQQTIEEFISCPHEAQPINGMEFVTNNDLSSTILMISLSLILALMYVFLGWYCWAKILKSRIGGSGENEDDEDDEDDDDDERTLMKTKIQMSKQIRTKSMIGLNGKSKQMSQLRAMKSVKSKYGFSPKSKLQSKLSSPMKSKLSMKSSQRRSPSTLGSNMSPSRLQMKSNMKMKSNLKMKSNMRMTKSRISAGKYRSPKSKIRENLI